MYVVLIPSLLELQQWRIVMYVVLIPSLLELQQWRSGFVDLLFYFQYPHSSLIS